ncbi:MAG: threonyl-tRNA synthetase editing domain-containing protein [Thermoproteota archaeon]|jgi:Threonyl-tRNA synthetase
MKILCLHCDKVAYLPIKKEIAIAEETDTVERKYENVLLLLTAVEKNDNEETVKKMVENIKKVMKELGTNNLLLYPFAHLSTDLKRPSEAIKIMNMLKDELSKLAKVNKAPFGWNKALELKTKGHPLAERLLTAD